MNYSLRQTLPGNATEKEGSGMQGPQKQQNEPIFDGSWNRPRKGQWPKDLFLI